MIRCFACFLTCGLLLFGLAGEARALSASPAVVNVRSTGPTTVFITYRGTTMFKPTRAFWCGEIDATGACVPGTIFGRVPASSENVMSSTVGTITSIVTFPTAVVRQASQRARGGGPSRFFYVQAFFDDSDGEIKFVPVLCRLLSGGAGVPFSLTEVRLKWKKDKPILTIPRGMSPPPFGAEIHYDGSGRLKGRWEVVLPGDSQPRLFDLVPEASLPVEERFKQRRYLRIARVDRVLPPTGKVFIPGPDREKLPSRMDGLHLILFRIEATTDKVASTNILGPGVPGGFVPTGGVAGFPIPVLRYYVGSTRNAELLADLTAGELQLVLPNPRAKFETGDPLTFSWIEPEDAVYYKLEVEVDGDNVLSAVLNPGISSYTAPPSLRDYAGERMRWRVQAIGNEEMPFATSDWRDFRIKK